MKTSKRGISPVVATVLLIILVVIIAVIIFLWMRATIKETVIKNGKAAELSCMELELEASVSGEIMSVVNRKNIPIYSLSVAIKAGGQTTVKNFPQVNIAPSGAGDFNLETLDYEEIEITPIILGAVNNVKQPFTCDKKFTATIS